MSEALIVPIAPTALDNHTVALWVIGTLVGLMLVLGPFVFKQVVKLILAHKKKLDDDLAACAEERRQFIEERERLARKIENASGEQRVELVKTVAANNTVLERIADSHDDLTKSIYKLTAHLSETGEHQARGR